MEILKKVRDKGQVNGYGVELAEAQAKDYMNTKKKIDAIEARQIKQGKMLTKLSGQFDVLIKYVTSPAEEERKEGIVWKEIKNMAKTPLGKTLIIIFLFSLFLTGQRIMEITGIIKPIITG